MKSFALILALIPAFAVGQTKGKFYLVSSGLNNGLKVASIKNVNNPTTLVLRISSTKDFVINRGDTLSITFSTNEEMQIICNKTSSFHSQQTASETFYNAAYYLISKTQEDSLKKIPVKYVSIANMSFTNLTEKNSKAFMNALNWFN